jgi:flagellar biosynthetic protein FlhB
MSAKPYDATPSRLERARREGDFPLAHDAVAFAAFLGSAVALAATWHLAAAGARGALRGDVRQLSLLAVVVAAVCAASSVGAVAATLAQTRSFGWRPGGLRFAIGQVTGFPALAAAARMTAAVVLAFGLGAVLLRPDASAVFKAFALVAAAGAANAVVDVVLSHGAWRKRLRMTHDELRRDQRENEGDPEMRGRRKRLHRTMLRGSLREVRRASFVVANPEHVAIAMRYEDDTPVPEILVRAADEFAARVRALARDAGIPTIVNVELARALYRHGRVGAIPADLYLAVAQVIAVLARVPES